ncbi:hypothetical protein V6N13_058098 [Hibiscus sabdariffa]|uniref:Uncharacterized protein n=1 Tax=Hibiscus sabdariffa TaxID=183260 RepID=A0ABR2GHS5_9ROSI
MLLVNLNGKRKMLFDEVNNPKKFEREAYRTGSRNITCLHDNGQPKKAPPRCMAESEVEGSTLSLVSGHGSVTYRFSANQMLCACHGTHMSPEECTKLDYNICLATFPSTNLAASAQN